MAEVKLITNRMSDLLRRSWAEVPKALYAPGPGDVVFSYMCNEPVEATIAPNDRFFRLIRPSIYNRYADKGRMPKILAEAGVAHLSAKTVDTVAEAEAIEDVEIWFSKDRFGTSGKGMSCVRRDELSSFELPKHFVLQSIIDDICLIDGKKFTSRFYLLVWNRQVHLFKGGFNVVHGVPYDPSSTDYKVQIDHSGYNEKDGAVYLSPMAEFAEIKTFFPVIAHAAKDLVPALEALVNASSGSDYIFLGIDCILQQSKSLKILEINSIPNFVHPEIIQKTTNIPFLSACGTLMLGGETDRLVRIG